MRQWLLCKGDFVMKVYGKEVPQEVIDAIEARMVGRFSKDNIIEITKILGYEHENKVILKSCFGYKSFYPASCLSGKIISRRACKGHIVYDKSMQTWSRTDLWE